MVGCECRRGLSVVPVAEAKALWRKDNPRERRPAVSSPGEYLATDWAKSAQRKRSAMSLATRARVGIVDQASFSANQSRAVIGASGTSCGQRLSHQNGWSSAAAHGVICIS
jgi:hypothetical protein